MGTSTPGSFSRPLTRDHMFALALRSRQFAEGRKKKHGRTLGASQGEEAPLLSLRCSAITGLLLRYSTNYNTKLNSFIWSGHRKREGPTAAATSRPPRAWPRRGRRHLLT